MGADQYLKKVTSLVGSIKADQLESIKKAAEKIADSIFSGNVCHLFGSGHSVLPVMDLFPRYGSFVGFHPLADPRLMWCNVVAPGGAPELLWIERAEGYIVNFLKTNDIRQGDTMVVYSHGGLNAAPVEAAMYAKNKGCKVIAVTSLANASKSKPTHSSGKKLSDVADVVIDNCVPPEDSLVELDGLKEPVAAGSTVAAIVISMSLVAETAKILHSKGFSLDVFVSPNVDAKPGHNDHVNEVYIEKIARRK